MMYPGSKSPRLDEMLFRHPDAHYRGVPFWSWNCKVTEDLIDRQLDMFKEMGFGGVDIHPRGGLDTEYLGDEYMHLIRYAVDQCEKKGLFCWLYDDDRFPSGAADGIVTRDWRFRQRYMLLTETLPARCCEDRAAFDEQIAAEAEPVGYFAAAYAITLRDGYLESYRRIAKDEPLQEGEVLRYACVMLLEPEDWFEGQTYVDVMNPEAIRRFIEVTHEAYLDCVGETFGKTVPAIFTDEPRMETRSRTLTKQLPDPFSSSNVALPYTEGLREQLLAEKGLDLLDVLPELVWDLPEGRLSPVRYHYRNAASERFVSSFMDQICNWCTQHNILMTGHVLSEDTLAAQAAALGDCMRCYRKMDLPGIDVLCDYRQFIAAKQAASVAHQFGREGVISEMYGVTQWDCDFKTYKLQGDWQAALGVTVRIPHLSWMSMEGEGKRDWPASIFYQSPWWKEYPYIEDYFARLNTVLTRGVPMVDVAILHPVESLWFYFGPVSQNAQIRSRMDEDFEALVQRMLFTQTDFDFLSESLLPQQDVHCVDGQLCVGPMRYNTVIVPDMITIRASTLDLLEAFCDAGGNVVFTGRIPHLVDALPDQRAERLAERCAGSAIITQHGITVAGSNAKLIIQRRQDADCQWLFMCHAYPADEPSAQAESHLLRIPGMFHVVQYDAMTGGTHELPYWHENSSTCINWRSFGEDSLLIRLTPCENEMLQNQPAQGIAQYHTVLRMENSQSAAFSEPNMLLLDYASAQLDDNVSFPKQEILRLDNEIRRVLGFSLRNGLMKQPWAIEERETHTVVFHYDIDAACSMACSLALERPENCSLSLNGQAVSTIDTGFYVDEAIRIITLPDLQAGCNTLTVRMRYNQKTNPEAMYLLGDFAVEMRPAGESRISPRSKMITIGDLTKQGLPFYTGNVVYTFCFDVQAEGEYALRVPHFCAPLMTVSVDGRDCGRIAYAPHRAYLGKLVLGNHEVQITVYGNRHNGFGPLHNANANYVWYGQDSFRTEGDEWTDAYCVRPNGILSAVEIELIER